MFYITGIIQMNVPFIYFHKICPTLILSINLDITILDWENVSEANGIFTSFFSEEINLKVQQIG
jgi:hypothetical protein